MFQLCFGWVFCLSIFVGFIACMIFSGAQQIFRGFTLVFIVFNMMDYESSYSWIGFFNDYFGYVGSVDFDCSL